MRTVNENWTVYQRTEEESQDSHGCDQLVGSSDGAQKVYDLIRRVANLPAFVMINGESGTGKELVARAIHNLGARADRPFVAVSCGAIPETLIEAELFGHEKGAFTGSIGSRAGLLEQAADGTLFLDEIGELSLNTQVKLLRVLQQKEFCRLGSNRPIPLKARVLFATHRNLREMVDAGRFREDFYFRVNVVKIEVPALRDRVEDLPALAMHFLHKYTEEYGKPVYEIRPEAMDTLMGYSWPGNIRELENVIQRAIILADGGSIGLSELPEEWNSDPEMSPISTEIGSENGSFDELLRDYKVKLVKTAVMDSKGNKSLAAKKLRVSRAYLHRLIRTEPELISNVA
jgi:DNA-binding NtrC family response regulator